MSSPTYSEIHATNENMPAHPVVLVAQGVLLNPQDPALVHYDIRRALDKWGEGQPHPTGSFLEAILTNDLKRAVGHADRYNMLTIPAIVAYMVNELPFECYGSTKKYDAWIAKAQTARTSAQETKR